MIDKKQTVPAAVWCALMMFILGASDALRGVFLPVFKNTFGLTQTQGSYIIMFSYIGCMGFMFIGGYISDRVNRKKFILAVSLMWMAALAAYVFTENYYVILGAMIFSMGASNMLSTTVNVITPMIFLTPAVMVNIFNFAQGAGMTVSQNVGGRFTSDIKYWHTANAIILGAAVISLIVLAFMKIPDVRTEDSGKKASYFDVFRNPACGWLILIVIAYCISEHGIQNWLTTYGSEHLGFTVEQSAKFLSVFFGGITIGRLLFAPLLNKIGVMKSLLIFSSAAAVLYVLGIILGKTGIYLICAAGLGYSVMWPITVYLIGRYYPREQAGAATGIISGFGTISDVVFNAVFGRLTEAVGLGHSIIILPIASAAFAVFFICLYIRVPHPEGE